MKPVIAIAVSGGIDSLTAGYLLKRQGYPVLGIHFITGYEPLPLTEPGVEIQPGSTTRRTAAEGTGKQPILDIARQLEIKIELIDIRVEFKRMVVDHFTGTYAEGRTPNPCMVCNPAIKFGTILNHARALGASALATGHYARIIRGTDGHPQLLKGADLRKDQSYFLARLSRHQLERACFPLGEMTKDEVKTLASVHGLKPVTKDESQDVCFISSASYGDFLLKQPGFQAKPGPIVTPDGQTIGTHDGLHLFTVGQRRGIGIPAAEPYYVIGLDTKNNRLLVGYKNELYKPACRVSEVNWIQPPPRAPIRVETKIRYRHHAVSSTVYPQDDGRVIVRFDTPQKAVTPGQGAVFYQNETVLGGGWIDS